MKSYDLFIKYCKKYGQTVYVIDGNDTIDCKLIEHTRDFNGNKKTTYQIWFNNKHRVYDESQYQLAYDTYRYILYKNS